MENIKFIKGITQYVERPRSIIGDCVYYNLNNGNKVKLWCYDMGVGAEVINKLEGRIDRVDLQFANYFKPTQCSPGAPKWIQHIHFGKWYFSETYTHVLPKVSDYKNIACAIEMYIRMFE